MKREAVKLYLKAAEQGDANAQDHLRLMINMSNINPQRYMSETYKMVFLTFF
jgi:TPR repeat protein